MKLYKCSKCNTTIKANTLPHPSYCRCGNGHQWIELGDVTDEISEENGCFDFFLHPKVENDDFPVKVYAMNVEGVIIPNNRNDKDETMIAKSMYDEKDISDSDWSNYDKEYCKIAESIIDYFKKTNYYYYGPSAPKTPALTCLKMPSQYRKGGGSLSRFLCSTNVFFEEWEKAWEVQMMDRNSYNNYRVELSKSDFILLSGRETLSELRAYVEKITEVINFSINKLRKDQMYSLPPINVSAFFADPQAIEKDKKAQEEWRNRKFSWRMIDGGDRIPNIAVLCSNLELTQDEYNSIMTVESRKMMFLKAIKRQQERQEMRFEQKEREELKRQEERKRIELLEKKRQFNSNNAHNRDAIISYNSDERKYTVGNQTYDNVRLVIKSFFPRFDNLKYAQETALLKGMEINDVQDEWRKKSEKTIATEIQFLEQVEHFYLGKIIPANHNIKLYSEFSNNVQLFPYRTRWHIYDEDIKMAGTIDMASGNSDSLVLYKLSTRDHLVENGAAIKNNKEGRSALSPIEHISDTLYYQFTLELSFYKFILEKKYNLQVSELRLGVFNESQKKPYVFRIPYLKSEVEKIVDSRNDVIY